MLSTKLALCDPVYRPEHRRRSNSVVRGGVAKVVQVVAVGFVALTTILHFSHVFPCFHASEHASILARVHHQDAHGREYNASLRVAAPSLKDNHEGSITFEHKNETYWMDFYSQSQWF